ncbi:hypothetical protein Ddye_016438 [Dipteronia dyeriana]|uniref:PHD-type domain-containing protein n=1 Tax=Dipteronia dyeriana TaxID=168575 RepID=A0AAD9U7P7_9ROSI|nr:hypothetical protein Ddye_016438 [Dipteronia dyeriana]
MKVGIRDENKTIVSWMIEKKMIKENDAVAYRNCKGLAKGRNHEGGIKGRIHKGVERPRTHGFADWSDDTCMVCGDGRELIRCQKGPSTFHSSCMRMKILNQEIPKEEWLCHN